MIDLNKYEFVIAEAFNKHVLIVVSLIGSNFGTYLKQKL